MNTALIPPVAIAAAFFFVANGHATEPEAQLQIVVDEGHYLAQGKVFDDLDELARAVRKAAPATVELDACGPASARALKAVAHRLRHLPLQLQVLQPGTRACLPAPRRVDAGQRFGLAPHGIDDAEVERYWRGVMP